MDSETRSANARGCVSVPGGCVGISLGYTLAIAHRSTECLESVNTPLRFELTQIRACLLFFSSTLSVVYVVSYVFVKKCEMPLAGDERNH